VKEVRIQGAGPFGQTLLTPSWRFCSLCMPCRHGLDWRPRWWGPNQDWRQRRGWWL